MRKIDSLCKTALLGAVLLLSMHVAAYAAPSISSLIGTISDGSSITISGSDFGANGPTIVVFDNFESGTNGATISVGAGSATVGQWDTMQSDSGGNQPVYDNTYSISGSQANMGDQTVQTSGGTDSSSSIKIHNLNATDVFLSYWFYLPTTSSYPCYNGSSCNWKVAWLYGFNSTDDDQVLPVGLPGSQSAPYRDWAISCNDCYASSMSWFSFNMQKGSWYRVSAWVHATNDNTSERDLWVMSTDDSIAVTQKVSWNGRIFKDADSEFENFSFNAWARWCNDCAESAPRFDDVYLATGANARARVEIGNASTYNASTNLAIATVTLWSNTSIAATVRQGAFPNFRNAYLYVVDADGVVNATGYLLCPLCLSPAGSVAVN